MYTELHLHDYYSTLDGLNSPAEYMKRASELGMTHLAQTNHGTLGGHREFQKAAKEAGITPILGVEAYISPTDRHDRRSKAKRTDGTSVYNHLIILAQNETGMSTLNLLNEKAWTEGFYNKPRIDLELLGEHNEGLIVLSGCLNGLLCKAIERGDLQEALNVAQRLKAMLPGRFYIEIQGHNPKETNEGLLHIADFLKIPAVVTSDCHYARKEDLWVEEAMLILSTNPKRNNAADFSKSQKMDILERFNYLYPERMMSFEEIQIYLKSADDHRNQLREQGIDRNDLFDNTMVIAKDIESYPYHEALDLLPRPKNGNPDEILEKNARAGLKRRGLDKNPEYVARLEEELEIIKAKDFSTYFLIIGNMIAWAKKQDIMVGPGRGSAAGSLVCYALGITEVDPIKFGLLFFRFINPERNDFPDIDTDFADRRRGEVKDYLRRQFKNVASIATVNKFQGKGVMRDAARVFNVPIGDVNKALKNIEAPPSTPEAFFDIFNAADKGKEFNKKYPEVMKLALELQGRIRSTGMHAAGLILSNQPISNFAPIESAKEPNSEAAAPRIPVIPYDMHTVEEIGFIKLDALGLKALTVIDDTLKMIEERHNRKVVLTEIGLEDKNIYHMLSEGYTKGVFQCEQPPYTTLILKMGGVHTFADLSASNALVRPGAANTIGPEYIARKNGKSPVTYPHEVMRPFTEETFGEILYQEQVMLTITDLAGMKMSTADKIRKIIGKKLDPIEFEPYRVEFIEGATKKVSDKVANKLWQDFLAHAGYSFNKSHAVAYSLVSYWTAWLKYYYPQEFMCAILKNEKDKDVRTDYLIEAKRLGIKVLLPHVNQSDIHFSVEGDSIRFGLSNVKYISDKTAPIIIKNRPFNLYEDLVGKVMEKGSGLNSRVLTALNAVGGAAFPDNPRRGDERDNFYEYLQIPAFEVKDLPPKVKLQFRTLDEYEDKGCFSIMAMVRGIKKGPGWARIEVVDETGSAGIFHTENTQIEPGNMYAMLVADNRVARYVPVSEIGPDSTNSFVQFLYTTDFPDVTEGFYKVVSYQPYTTKAGKKMAYLVLCDSEKNMTRVMAFPTMYMKAYSKCKEGATVMAVLDKTDDGSVYLKEIS
jgi:DNA polymerase-3 subunit alpha